MARLITLAAYAIKIWSREEREAETISSFGADDSDILDFLRNFLTGLQTKSSQNKDFQHVLRVKQLKDEGRRLYGVIETGDYGQESVLLNVETEKVVHERKTIEANMLPFYFLMDLPEGTDEGVIILQRTGMFGIRKMLHHVLNQEFAKAYGDFGLRLLPLVEEQEIAKYKDGKIESIRFINFAIPSDVTDCFDGGHKEKVGHAELVIRARRGTFLPLNGRLRQFFSGKRELADLIALDETNFKYQDIKVKTKVGRTTRTVDLRNLNRLRGYHDITDDVELDPKTGHPKFSSIHEIADRLVKKIKRQIGIE